jgi:Na+/proline symporter
MFEGWAIVTLGVSYIGTLFLIAAIGDRFFRAKKGGEGRPFIYSLSLAVYCTSWTFFGSVGLAASTGYDFIPVYIGPLLFFVFGTPLLLRVIRLAKSQNLTSVADFIAARYGKSQTVAAVVTVIAVIGSLPYIALQLKAVVLSVGTLLARGNAPVAVFAENVAVETSLAVALALAAFAMLFGTRHTDATEHQDGLMFAIAAESLVKLAAFFAVGLFVVYGLYGDPVAFVAAAGKNEIVESTFSRPFNGGTFLTVTLLSFFAILLLPRQFHVAVVENNAESEVRRAQWMFPLYLVLINVFVVPIAAAGLMRFESGVVDADLFVLALPLAENAKVLAVIKTPISAVLERCNVDSDNLYAESLLKSAGNKVTGQPGSWSNGAAVVRMQVKERLGADQAALLVMSDGSGLSRNNRVSPEMLARWLANMATFSTAARTSGVVVSGRSTTLKFTSP